MDRAARHGALGDRGRRTRRICLQPAGATGRNTACFLLIIRNGSNWYRCKIWTLIKWSCDLVGSNVLKWSSHVENGPSVCDAISEIFLTRYISNENNSWKCFIFFNALLIGCVSQTLYKCFKTLDVLYIDWMKMCWIWLDENVLNLIGWHVPWFWLADLHFWLFLPLKQQWFSVPASKSRHNNSKQEDHPFYFFTGGAPVKFVCQKLSIAQFSSWADNSV